jgi:hypothetical protein
MNGKYPLFLQGSRYSVGQLNLFITFLKFSTFIDFDDISTALDQNMPVWA